MTAICTILCFSSVCCRLLSSHLLLLLLGQRGGEEEPAAAPQPRSLSPGCQRRSTWRLMPVRQLQTGGTKPEAEAEDFADQAKCAAGKGDQKQQPPTLQAQHAQQSLCQDQSCTARVGTSTQPLRACRRPPSRPRPRAPWPRRASCPWPCANPQTICPAAAPSVGLRRWQAGHRGGAGAAVELVRSMHGSAGGSLSVPPTHTRLYCSLIMSAAAMYLQQWWGATSDTQGGAAVERAAVRRRDAMRSRTDRALCTAGAAGRAAGSLRQRTRQCLPPTGPTSPQSAARGARGRRQRLARQTSPPTRMQNTPPRRKASTCSLQPRPLSLGSTSAPPHRQPGTRTGLQGGGEGAGLARTQQGDYSDLTARQQAQHGGAAGTA